MATNFKIQIYRNSDNVHLKLSGDFDGNSAHELINTINGLRYKAKLFIHTSCLKQLNTFGVEVFRKNINSLNVRLASCWFTGDKATELIPEKNTSFLVAYR
jgi:anti-anti-sigma regulatory factor